MIQPIPIQRAVKDKTAEAQFQPLANRQHGVSIIFFNREHLGFGRHIAQGIKVAQDTIRLDAERLQMGQTAICGQNIIAAVRLLRKLLKVAGAKNQTCIHPDTPFQRSYILPQITQKCKIKQMAGVDPPSVLLQINQKGKPAAAGAARR